MNDSQQPTIRHTQSTDASPQTDASQPPTPRSAAAQPTEQHLTEQPTEHLLGAADIRRIAADAGITPTKKFGQNFVIDPGTVRRIVREADVHADTHVMEVGPGLGSLTLAILETGATMTAVEIDPPLAERLPRTVAEFMPTAAGRLTVVNRDALTASPDNTPGFDDGQPFTLVANLPYNVATPIILTLLERFDNLQSFLVMVQKEVADRLAAEPGSKIYGTPSVKLAWYGRAKRVGNIGRNVFWPAPNVDSALVRFDRYTPQEQLEVSGGADRETTFRLIDAAFSQRRKTLHAALRRATPPTPAVSEAAFAQAHIDPTRRGETLRVTEFAALAAAIGRSTAAGQTAATGQTAENEPSANGSSANRSAANGKEA